MNFDNEELKKLDALNLNSSLFNFIDRLASSADKKWELLSFAFEFVVNGKFINISKTNDGAIDKLYPLCRELRKSKSKFLDNNLLEIA